MVRMREGTLEGAGPCSVDLGVQSPVQTSLPGRSTRSRLCSSLMASSPSPSSTTSPSRGPQARTPAAGLMPLAGGGIADLVGAQLPTTTPVTS